MDRYRQTPLSGLVAGLAVAAAVVAVPQGAARADTHPVQAVYYAAPGGAGAACTHDDPCSLTGARDLVRQHTAGMTGDLVVRLLDGTYPETGPLTLTEDGATHDSGSNGFDVVYEAAPGAHPVLSGGRRVTGWSLQDATNNVWRAHVGDLATRQLYVNGVRAVRDHGTVNPDGWVKTAAGWTAPDATMASWRNPTDVEILGFYRWKAFRCPVEAISGQDVTMQQPCWQNANRGSFGIHTVTWVENAYELLGTPGQFYLDRAAGDLYYVPRPGEDLTTADVEAPVAQSLLTGTGTAATPLHNLVIRGLTFAYATWLGPNTDVGYPGGQSGVYAVTGGAHPVWEKTPANVSFAHTTHVRIEGNTFVHLGAAGLTLDTGSQDDTVVGNIVADTSHSGIQIGDSEDSAQTDPGQQNARNTVRDNVLRNIGAEYPNAAGIWFGYSDSATIADNDLAELSHTGISIGWGWGKASYARNNTIRGNHIHDAGQVLWDMGGIYTLSAQPGSVITGNVIDGVGHDDDRVSNGIYLDEGTAYYTAQHNVVRDAHNWLSIWTTSQHDNTVTDNVADRDMAQCPVNVFGPTANCNTGTNVVTDNVLGGAETPPRSGPTGRYAALNPPRLAPLPWVTVGLDKLRPAEPQPGPEDLAAAGHPNTYHPVGSPRG